MQERIDYFKATYGFRDEDIILIPYGSRVYGTHSEEKSDYDFIAIIPANRKADTGTEYRNDALNIHMFNRYDFQNQLNDHKIHTLETYFHPDNLLKDFKFTLDLGKLRDSVAEKASHSFVKAKKKIDKEKDFYVGWKSLFHSLRILKFGLQIASKGKIHNFSEANDFWFEILNAQEYNWDYFKKKYQPIYNELASAFRKVAPKTGEKVY